MVSLDFLWAEDFQPTWLNDRSFQKGIGTGKPGIYQAIEQVRDKNPQGFFRSQHTGKALRIAEGKSRDVPDVVIVSVRE
jgi:hypothetical protein